MSRRKILLIDASNCVMRWTSTMENAVSPDGLPIGGLYGVISTSRSLIAAEGFTSVVAVLDWGVPKYRYDLFPAYKGQRANNRKADPKAEAIYKKYKQQLPYLRNVLKHTGITTARAESWEADDSIAALALLRFQDAEVTICSSDKDFTTIVSDRIRVYDPINKVYREEDPLYTLKRACDPKDSDNLDGVTGIGKVTADKLITAWVNDTPKLPKTLPLKAESFIAWCATRPADKKCAAVIAEQQNVRINVAITDMHKSAEMCDPHIKVQRGAFDKDGFKNMCNEYGMRPFLEGWSATWPPFSRLECPF